MGHIKWLGVEINGIKMDIRREHYFYFKKKYRENCRILNKMDEPRLIYNYLLKKGEFDDSNFSSF